MIIKNIKIENFGKLDHFESSFNQYFTTFTEVHAQTVINAIGVILKNTKILNHLKKTDIKKDTHIEAEFEVDNEQYLVLANGIPKEHSFRYTVQKRTGTPDFEFYSRSRSSPEEDEIGIFYVNGKVAFSEKFQNYKDKETYYPSNNFGIRTNGIGNTKTFRTCLSKFISAYTPEKISGKENYELHIGIDGKFIAVNTANANDRTSMSLYEKVSFEYLCFLNVNRFWQTVEDIRDFNHDNCPLLVIGSTTSATESVTLSKVLKAARIAERQIIVGIEVQAEDNKQQNATIKRSVM